MLRRVSERAVLPPDYDPGVDPAIHAAPPRRKSRRSAADGRKHSETTLFDFAIPLRLFSAPKRVGGQDEPGHDGLGPASRRHNMRNSAANTYRYKSRNFA